MCRGHAIGSVNGLGNSVSRLALFDTKDDMSSHGSASILALDLESNAGDVAGEQGFDRLEHGRE
jgi:hypothetical protein